MSLTKKIFFVLSALLIVVYLAILAYTDYQKWSIARYPSELSCVDGHIIDGRIYRQHPKGDWRTTPNRTEILIETEESVSHRFDITFVYNQPPVGFDYDPGSMHVCYLKKFPDTIVTAAYKHTEISTDSWPLFNPISSLVLELIGIGILALAVPMVVRDKVPVFLERFKNVSSTTEIMPKIFKIIVVCLVLLFVVGTALAILAIKGYIH